jgi:hypothetical protein
MTKKVRTKAVGLLGSSALLFTVGGGNCLPDNYWANAFGNVIDATVVAAATTFVDSQLQPVLNPDGE